MAVALDIITVSHRRAMFLRLYDASAITYSPPLLLAIGKLGDEIDT